LIAFGVYDGRRKLVLWWVATGTSGRPNTLLVLDVARGRMEGASILRYGWSVYDGILAQAHCALMFAKTLAAVRPIATVPYVGNFTVATGTQQLLRQDGTLNTDAGTAFRGSIASRYFTGGTLRRRKRLMEAYLVAKAGAATITQALTKDFGQASVASTQSLVPSGAESRVRRFFDATDIADLIALQLTIGDGEPLDQTFELDQWIGADELETGAR
jgi:hypothetical protein